MSDGNARPLDVLGDARGTNVMIELKDETVVSGTLRAFDSHLNMWLDDASKTGENGREDFGKILIRGDNVVHVSPE
jgi:small nuclear ribonucleoprotein (snRNP)-like protein